MAVAHLMVWNTGSHSWKKSFEKMDAKLDILIRDISYSREENSRNIANLKVDVSKEISGLRTDVSRDISNLREDVSKDISSLREDVSYLKGKIETLPSGESFGELRGRVDSLPTTAKLASLLGLAVGAIAIINNWQAVKLFILGA
jgi:hypothetical protein